MLNLAVHIVPTGVQTVKTPSPRVSNQPVTMSHSRRICTGSSLVWASVSLTSICGTVLIQRFIPYCRC